MKMQYYLLLNIVIMPLYAMELDDIFDQKGKEPTASVKELKRQASKLRASDVEEQLRTASDPHLTDQDVIPSQEKQKPALKVSGYSKMPLFNQSTSVGVPILSGLEEIEGQEAIDVTIVKSVMDLIKADAEKDNPMIKPETIQEFDDNPALGAKLRNRVTQLRDSEVATERDAFNSLSQYSSGREELKRRPPMRGRDSIAYDRATDERAKALVYPLLVSILQEHAQEQKVLVEALTKQGVDQAQDGEKKLKTKNKQLFWTIVGGAGSTILAAIITAAATIPGLLIGKKC